MTGGQNGPRASAGTDLALSVVAVLVAAAGVLWAAAAASAWLAGRPLPGFTLTGLAVLAHPASPAAVWHGQAGPAWLYWLAASVAAAVAAGTGTATRRLWQAATAPASAGGDMRRRAGWASRAQVRRHVGQRMAARRARTIRPSLPRPRPADAGYLLGKSRGITCWASAEDSILLLGPPRSGKGMHVVISMILDAPGAVVTTSTRPDNLAVTLTARRSMGPVMVFDPQGLAGGAGHTGEQGTLAWPLERGCDQPRTALVRAEALVPAAGGNGVENGNFWRQQALTVTRCLLHAAALGGLTAADIFRWSHSAGAAKEAVAILAGHKDAAQGWGRGLDAVISADQRTRDSVWAMVANTFAPLADPGVLAAVAARPGQQVLDPGAFLAGRGTIYLLGTASGAAAAAPLVAALTEDLVHAARIRASRSPGQRLDPPMLLALDEAANYPLPSLPSLMSEGGGTGITTLTVLQSLAQARDKWGAQAGAAIWDAAIVKIILGGGGNAADLADISRLAGEIPVTEWTRTLASGPGAGSASASVRYRPVLEPADIRRLAYGTGLLPLPAAGGQVIVVEGVIDALAIAAAAITAGQARRFCPVTQSGRELSDVQLGWLARCARPVVLGFDGDSAGMDSAFRYVAEAARTGLPVRATILPGGHDPASWLAAAGPGGLAAWDITSSPGTGPRPVPGLTWARSHAATGQHHPSPFVSARPDRATVGGNHPAAGTETAPGGDLAAETPPAVSM